MKEKGFTLIEIAIVATLLAVLGGLIFGTLRGVSNARSAIEQKREINRTARHVLIKIRRELQSVSSTTGNSLTGVKFEIKNDFLGDADADYITFNTAIGGDAHSGLEQNFGYLQVAYFLEKIPPDIAKSRGYDNSKNGTTYALIREELPNWVTSKQNSTDEEIVRTALAYNVVGFNFRHYKDKQWSDDSTKRSPNAIEITVSLQGKNGVSDSYKTSVALKSSQ